MNNLDDLLHQDNNSNYHDAHQKNLLVLYKSDKAWKF